MDIKNDFKNGVKLCADAATDVAQALVEKSRLKAKANRIKQVIKADTELMNQAYIELGKYFYENHREEATADCEALCVVVDKTTTRINKASRRYVELLSDSNDVKLKSENTEKIKKIVTDTAEDIKGKAMETGKKAKDKATDLGGKAKIKAQDLSNKAKETVADFKDKAKDKAQDFKSFIAPDEIDEEFVELTEEDYEIVSDKIEIEEKPVDSPVEVADTVSEANEFVDTDDEIADLNSNIEMLKPQDETLEVITAEDEESPEEFEF